MGISEAQKRRDKEYRRQAAAEWNEATETVAAEDTGTGKDKRLHRDNKRIALTRIEEAARTKADFEKVSVLWDRRDRTEAERVGDHEKQCIWEELVWQAHEKDTIIPPPLTHVYWRQLITGEFLDFINDCPLELHEISSSEWLVEYMQALNDKQKELFYYRAIRQWSPQKLAVRLDFTDRYIRKMYTEMMDTIRRKLFERLYPRYDKQLPLTHSQTEFVKQYREQFGKNKTNTH